MEKFGKKSLEICRDNHEELAQIKGISLSLAKDISDWVKANKEHEENYIFLNKLLHGIGASKDLPKQLIQAYGINVQTQIRENPYRLTKFHNVSFKRADKIAQRLEFGLEKPERIRAAIEFVFDEAAQLEGHTFLYLNDAIYRVQRLLNLDIDLIEPEFVSLEKKDRIVVEPGDNLSNKESWCALRKFVIQERSIAQKSIKMLSLAPHKIETDLTDINSHLYDDQKNALEQILNHNILILTGSPGTGKTSMVKAIIRVLEGYRIKLCAPTGKAAGRLEHTSNHPATTIHKMLKVEKYNNGNFKFVHNALDPVEADVVIVDEASMIDVNLAYSLMQALREDCRLILIGDIHQLPPVGPGNFLRDLMTTRLIPYVELKEIKRTNPGNILKNCERVKNGQDIIIKNELESDFFFVK